MDQRNPYLILGIAFGATREEANSAFVRRARPFRRRSDAEAKSAMTDLTWALNQIDVGIARPAVVMTLYRVPADPDVLTDPAAVIGCEMGVLAPGPEPMAPDDGDRSAAAESIRAAAVHEYLQYLVRLHGERTVLPDA
jgi:hypothetical protein